MIWERDWGNTGIFFENEKDAEEYCKLKNNSYAINYEAHYSFIVKPMTFYNSMEDYKTIKNKDYKDELKDAIAGLKESIEKIQKNNYSFDVRLNDGYYLRCDLEEFEEILNNFKEERYYVSTPGYETFLGYEPGKSRYLTKEDLPIVEKGYKKAKQQLSDMKITLKRYQKEYVELCGSKKENKEEKELIK